MALGLSEATTLGHGVYHDMSDEIDDQCSGVCTSRDLGWGETQARGPLESVHPPDPETSNVHKEVGRSHDVLMQEVLCVCYVGWLGRAITCQYLCTLRLNGIMPFWLKGQRWGKKFLFPLSWLVMTFPFLEQDLKAMVWAEGGGDFWHQQWCLSTPLTAWAAASQVPLAMVAGLRLLGIA